MKIVERINISPTQYIMGHYRDPRINFGEILNDIQNRFEGVAAPDEWNAYLAKTDADYSKCEDHDGILLNGSYFDWKEYDRKRDQVVEAFLRYFSEDQLIRIANTYFDQEWQYTPSRI